MAKKKQAKQTAAVASEPKGAPASSPSVEQQTTAPSPRPREGALRFRDYILLNVLFDVFCIVQLVLARLFIRETRGLYFFFGMLIVGFLLVSLFDYAYDRLIVQKEEQQSARS